MVWYYQGHAEADHSCFLRPDTANIVKEVPEPTQVRKTPELAQKLGQLQSFVTVLPPECMGQLTYFGPA